MSIREVKAFFAARGMEDKVLEFATSSATDSGGTAAGGNGWGRQDR